MNFRRFRQNAVIPGHPLLTCARWISWSVHCALKIDASVTFAEIPQKMRLIPKARNFGSTSIFIKRDHYEPELLACKTFIPRGGFVIDVGGSFGIYTLFFANFVGPDGRVLTFEPGTLSFSILSQNVSGSGLKNIEIHKMALSATQGEKTLYHIANSPVNFSLGGASGVIGETVSTAPLDAVISGGHDRKVSFIKMDVEGYEKFVLDGAQQTIASDRPVVMFEVSRSAVARAGLTEMAPFQLLMGLDYRFFTIKTGFVAAEPPAEGNIFAVPIERVRDFPVLPQTA